MIIHYHETEQTKQGIHFSVGVHFEDEPDSCYVILIDAGLEADWSVPIYTIMAWIVNIRLPVKRNMRCLTI
jgi:hypothetical protein